MAKRDGTNWRATVAASLLRAANALENKHKVRAAFSDSQFWDLIEWIGWDGVSDDWDAIKKKILQKVPLDQLDDLHMTFQKMNAALTKQIEKWEAAEGEVLGLGDDSFSDLVSHIIGLGKDEYNRVMRDPSLVKERVKRRGGFAESFTYAIPWKSDIENLSPKKYIAWAQRLVDQNYPLGGQDRIDILGRPIPTKPPTSSAGKAAMKLTQDALKALADGDVASFLAMEDKLVPAVKLLRSEVGSNEWAVINLISDMKKFLS